MHLNLYPVSYVTFPHLFIVLIQPNWRCKVLISLYKILHMYNICIFTYLDVYSTLTFYIYSDPELMCCELQLKLSLGVHSPSTITKLETLMTHMQFTFNSTLQIGTQAPSGAFIYIYIICIRFTYRYFPRKHNIKIFY